MGQAAMLLGRTLMEVLASLGGSGMPAGADGQVAGFTAAVQSK